MELITKAAQRNYTPPSTSIVHSITASLVAGERPGVVHITQYDQTLPIIAVRLMGNNVPYAVPTGAAVNFRAKKPDGKYIYNPALGISADGSTAYVAVTKQTAAAAGKMRAVIEIVLNGSIAATANFEIDIARNPVPQDAIESSDEYKTIYDLIRDAQASADAAASSATAAAGSASAAAASASASQESASASASSAAVSANSANAAKNSEDNAASSAAAADASATAAQNSASASEQSANAASQSATRAEGYAEDAKRYAEQAQSISEGMLGYYETPADLQAAHPTAQAGYWAIVGSTDTIWVWDTGSDQWVDTHQKTDLSNYYTKEQTDAAIANGNVKSADYATSAGTATTANGLAQSVINSILLAAHPVGSLYWSSASTSPATLFGGTWARITNKFIYALADGTASGSTGGNSTIDLQHLHSTGNHTLTTSEIPSHVHGYARQPIMYSEVKSGDEVFYGNTATSKAVAKDTIAAGGGGAHNHGNTGNALLTAQSIMPPYVAYYCWRRTA